ncbi:MAG: PPC domain-containing protein [Hydrococcus sp. C42_A2020_068]|uniref:Peptidase n=1 Tax=Hydrococcus rivularis NIES-593 TaxID=1921803 RepID=A0A1U7HKH9_9CYAN|nr:MULTISPECIES: PPC domain-containing protein [Pleurocapsales]AFY78597.1 putative pre-peptidase [Pleurocapsa sp. PCC 7327]MBF2021977.1 PPC domain-containing protein [Hydrococcus sp. C42_A2020_068]OKH24092.1 peptidase [Hydrococcus rivularis NIES-593]
MAILCVNRWHLPLVFGTLSLLIGLKTVPVKAQEKLYNPLPMPTNSEISDKLTERDIPTGEGGFARDYFVQLEEGDQVAIDLTSDDFDSIIVLLAADGSTVAENDDGPDGSTNSLLFARITETGNYIIRVRAFGETGSGNFKLKMTRLRPVK